MLAHKESNGNTEEPDWVLDEQFEPLKDENVWNYPRPAICKPFLGRLRVIHGSVELANTKLGFRVLETSHAPTYYIPKKDIKMEYLRPNSRKTFCEWKGRASYLDFVDEENGVVIENVAWMY